MKTHYFYYLLLGIIMGILFFACHDDPLVDPYYEPEPMGNTRQLTVAEAKQVFEAYASRPRTKEGTRKKDMPFNPGMITPLWKEATESANRVNSSVDIPVYTEIHYEMHSSRTEDWVYVSQKLVVVQEDSSRNRSVYLLNIIPDASYAKRYGSDISRHFKNSCRPVNFSGLFVYTDIKGGLPVYIGSYEKGKKKNEVYIFDKKSTFKESIDKINLMLKDCKVRSFKPLTRSETETNPDDSLNIGNWTFHTDGDSYLNGDGIPCWKANDGQGNIYEVADLDGDGVPDTIMGDSSNVNPGGGNNDWGWSGGGGIGGGIPNENPDPPINPGSGNDNDNKEENKDGSIGIGDMIDAEKDTIRPVRALITDKICGTAIVAPGAGIKDRYEVPLYELIVSGIDKEGIPLISSFSVIRFGVIRYSDGSDAVVGLSDAQSYIVYEYDPHKYEGGRLEAGAWRVFGSYLIHDGQDDNVLVFSAHGCIELFGLGAFGQFNGTLLSYSGAKSEIELAQSGKFMVMYASAPVPPLKKVSNI